MEKDVSLTHEQKKAFLSLKRAFEKCSKSGVYVWDNYGRISAVNGKIVQEVNTGGGYDDILDDTAYVSFFPSCLGNSVSDDKLFVVYT